MKVSIKMYYWNCLIKFSKCKGHMTFEAFEGMLEPILWGVYINIFAQMQENVNIQDIGKEF